MRNTSGKSGKSAGALAPAPALGDTNFLLLAEFAHVVRDTLALRGLQVPELFLSHPVHNFHNISTGQIVQVSELFPIQSRNSIKFQLDKLLTPDISLSRVLPGRTKALE